MLPHGKACSTCALGGCSASFRGAGFLTPDGKMESGVMIVGKGLNKSEVVQGRAMVGAGGFLLARQMQKCGWNRDFFRYANAIFCQPPDREDIRISVATDYCPYLDAEIDTVRPKIILTLGQEAFTKVTGEHLGIHAARGYLWREKRGRCWVVAGLDPDFIRLGNNHLALALRLDMEKAVRLAKLESVNFEKLSCVCDPRVGDWEDIVENKILPRLMAGYPLAGDIETPYKSDHAEDEDELVSEDDETWQIDRCSFSVNDTVGYSVPWHTQFLSGVKKIINAAMLKGPALFWNRPFDRPRIAKALNMSLPVEHVRDTMDAWHVLYNCLPKKLGFASSCLPVNDFIPAWKHLSGIQPAYYSAMDAVMLWRNDEAIMKGLRETGQIGAYEPICEQSDPLLEKMTQKGLLVDPSAKGVLKAKVEGLMAENVTEMQSVVPDHLKGVKVWKTLKMAEKGLPLVLASGDVPADATLFELPGTKDETTCGNCGLHPVTKTHVTRKTMNVV